MKKKTKLFYYYILLGVFLSGCGTNNQVNTTNNSYDNSYNSKQGNNHNNNYNNSRFDTRTNAS